MNNSNPAIKKNFRPLKKIVLWINFLSLDVVIGSLLSSIYVAGILKVELVTEYWFILPAAVWVIYKGDHLLDTIQLKSANLSLRLHFVKRNFKKLVASIIFLSIICLSLALMSFDEKVLIFGLLMSCISVVYFGLVYLFSQHQNFKYLKGVFVALIYTAGIWGTPILLYHGDIQYQLIFLITCFFILALINVFILLLINPLKDQDKPTSIPSLSLIGKIMITLLLLTTLGCSLSLFTNIDQDLKAAFSIQSLMAVISIFIILSARYKPDQAVFRFYTECVFWIPGLFFIWNKM